MLQSRLQDLNELALILKHAHGNLVEPQFITVHKMPDSQTDEMRDFVDEIAERRYARRVAKRFAGQFSGASPPSEYPLGRATAQEHLRLIDKYYIHNTESQRFVLEHFGDLNPMTEDLLATQTRAIEKLQ